MFRFLIKIFSRLLSIDFSRKYMMWFDIVYSSWIKSFMPNVARSVLIEHGLKLVGEKSIFISSGSILRKEGRLEAISGLNGDSFDSCIKIGSNCDIGPYFKINAINSISIGNNVLMGNQVTIIDQAHGQFNIIDISIPPARRRLYSKGAVIIEDDVWICDKVTICAGVHIGKGTVIAANSVVTKDIPAYCMAAGIPAKVVKRLDINE